MKKIYFKPYIQDEIIEIEDIMVSSGEGPGEGGEGELEPE